MYYVGASIGPFNVQEGTMPRKSKTDREMSWLGAMWEEIARTELIHAGFTSVTIRPTAMRSRFHVEFEFVRPASTPGLPAYRGKVRLSYPNGDAVDFLSWLWNQARLFSEYVENDDIAAQVSSGDEGLAP